MRLYNGTEDRMNGAAAALTEQHDACGGDIGAYDEGIFNSAQGSLFRVVVFCQSSPAWIFG